MTVTARPRALDCNVTVLGRCRKLRCWHLHRTRPTIVLTGHQAKRLSSVLVYAWFRLGCLYVGMSTRGLHRLFTPGHVLADVLPTDRVEIYPCQTSEEAQRLERRLIRDLRPERNKDWHPDHPEFAHGIFVKGRPGRKWRLGRRKKPGASPKKRVPEFKSAYWRRQTSPSPPAEAQ